MSRWAMVPILLWAVSVRALLIAEPFRATPEGVGAYYAIMARNALRVDWSVSKGVPVQSVGLDVAGGVPVRYYAHHPPLLVLLMAGSIQLFGDGEWQARLPSALASVGVTWGLYAILAARGRAGAGVLAAGIYACLPMVHYYGAQPELINPLLVAFVLAAAAGYERFWREPTWRRLAWPMLALAAAGCVDWPAFVLVPVLCGHFVLTRAAREWPKIVVFGAWATLVFAGLYAHIAVAERDWRWMVALLNARAGGAGWDLDWHVWWAKAWDYNRTYHTVPVMLLAAGWVATRPWRGGGGGGGGAARVTALLLAWAACHIALGRQGCEAHAWWWWPLTPGLVFAAALCLDALVDAGLRIRFPARSACAVAGVAFAAWGLWRVWPLFHDPSITSAGKSYDPLRIGRAIRHVAPNPNDTVIFVSGEDHPAIWYYADRPIKLHVWTVAELEARRRDDHADLPFSFRQPWPHPPTAVVLPANYAGAVPELLSHLRTHHAQLTSPPHLADYLFFRLSPPAGLAGPVSLQFRAQ